MSEEHKALGYRPPPGSLAAEAQAAAAKRPVKDISCGVTPEQLREIALKDAERIKKEREAAEASAAAVDLSKVGEGVCFACLVALGGVGC